MQNEKRYFNGGLNSDDDFELVGEGQWVNAQNIRYGSTDKGAVGRIESIGGTTEIPNSYLPTAGINKGNGACEDEANNRLILFNYNSKGNNGIYCYEKDSDTFYIVLLESQITGGLNFSAGHFIDSGRVVNGVVYWTDNLNEPRRINIDAGIKLNHPTYVTNILPYTAPLTQAVTTVIRRQPGLPVLPRKFFQSVPHLVNNFIQNEAFMFCYYYEYREHEIGTLSGLSQLVPFNMDTTIPSYSFNYIEVDFPFLEDIDQDVLRVNLVVIYLKGGKYFTIKTWDKRVAADAAQMAAHTAGITQLTYNFFNNEIGTALGDVFSKKQYDPVPIICKSLEIAKSRLFMTDYLTGYDTPVKTSLTAVVTIGTNTSNPVAEWFLLSFNITGASPPFRSAYVIYTTNFEGILGGNGYYRHRINYPGVPPLATTITYTDLIFIGADLYTATAYVASGSLVGVSNIQTTDQNIAPTITDTPPSTLLSGSKIFKSDAGYQVGIVFFDNYGRKCGVLTNSSLLVNTADRSFDDVPFANAIKWTLSNTDAANEIPAFAYYYAIVITQCLRTRYFIQGRSVLASYARFFEGAWVFDVSAYADTNGGCAFNIVDLTKRNMGYTFTAGDIIKVYIEGSSVNPYVLAIKAQQGDWVICELQNMNTLDNTSHYIYELYTPYQKASTEPYYEVASFNKITDPGTASRQYISTSGNLNGDVFLLNRTDDRGDYLTEAMSPNDKFFKVWYTDAGRPNFIDIIGQKLLSTGLRWGNTYIEETVNNGLSTFDVLDQKILPLESGPVNKLQLTSKVSEQGDIMLAICEKETLSIYLGEVQILGSDGNAYLASSASVVGTVNPLKGSLGTIHPESVIAYNGLVWWFDQRNGGFVQYSLNGLDLISSNKFTRAANLLAENLLPGQLIIGGIDPHHKEPLFSIPQTEDMPPKGYLEDYDGIVYPYDIYDGKAKTLVYKQKLDKWVGSYDHTAEVYVRLGNDLYSVFEGALYKNNTASATIYNKPFRSRVMYPVTQPVSSIKTFSALALEGNIQPCFVHLRTEDPYIQSSDLIDEDFSVKEGVKEAAFLRNRLDPNKEGPYIKKQLTGEKLFGKYLLVMLEFNRPLELKFSNVLTTANEGHFIDK